MIKTETVTINGNEYVIQTFDAIKGNLILFKLIKYLRGGTSLFDDILKDGKFLDVDLSALSIGSTIEQIISNIDPEDMNDFIIMMLKNTSYKNSQLNEDFIKNHFAGNYLDMYKLIAAIIKINYFNEGTKSFFAQARQKLKPLAEQKQPNNMENTEKS